MTAIRRGNGRWAAKYDLAGEQIWVKGGPWSTKREAQQAEQRDRERRGKPLSEETCATFAKRWTREWPRPAESTQRQYADAAARFAKHFGDLPLAELHRLTARTWALTQPRQISRVLGTMYEDARNVGLVEANPFASLRLPIAERKREITAPSMDDYKALLAACTALGGYGPEFRAMIECSAWTGIRAGELQALRWDDVGAETIAIERTRHRDGTVGPPKNGKARTVALIPPARVLDSFHPREGSPWVFHTAQARPLMQGSHHYAWRVVRAAAGIEHRWHDLRHFCATQLLEMGFSHFDVSVQLGHTDGGKLVMERYGHPSEDAARRRLLAGFELDPDQFRRSVRSREAAS